MATRLVFKAEFEGDEFTVIKGAQYLWEQKAGNDIIAQGACLTLVDAIAAVHKQIESWAADIDAGLTVCGGV